MINEKEFCAKLREYADEDIDRVRAGGDIIEICAVENAWSRVWQAIYNVMEAK